MLVHVEYRGIKQENTEYMKDGKRESMTVNTLFLEQVAPGNDDVSEGFQMRLRDEQVAAFSGVKRGDQIWIDLAMRHVEDRASKIRGMLISGVRLVARDNHTPANGKAAPK